MAEMPESRWSHSKIALSRLLIKVARKLDPPKPASFSINSAVSINSAQSISGESFAHLLAAQERLDSARRRAQRPLHPEPL